MGYTINLIQIASGADAGAIWNGSSFIREIVEQDDYVGAQFITGDPESIPDNFPGLPVGEYRVMTFLAQGFENFNLPMVNGVPFGNFASQPVANAVNVTFTGGGGGTVVTLDPSAPFDDVANLPVGMYLFFTEQQINDNSLDGYTSPNFPGSPEYNGLYWMQLSYREGRGYYTSGWASGGPTGPISALYLIVY